MTGEAREQDPRRRAAFRAFVRANHPDVGGDAERFRAGLAEFGRSPIDPSRAPRLDTGRSDPDRFDQPVTFVVAPSGVAALVRRLKRWWRRRQHRRVL